MGHPGPGGGGGWHSPGRSFDHRHAVRALTTEPTTDRIEVDIPADGRNGELSSSMSSARYRPLEQVPTPTVSSSVPDGNDERNCAVPRPKIAGRGV